MDREIFTNVTIIIIIIIIISSVLLTKYCAGDKIEKNEMGGHVARLGRREECIGFWSENLRERDHWGNSGVDGRMILGWIFRKWDVLVWTGLGWLRIETGGGHLCVR
jgi:hypothetical protein